jgi:hypothetical protein
MLTSPQLTTRTVQLKNLIAGPQTLHRVLEVLSLLKLAGQDLLTAVVLHLDKQVLVTRSGPVSLEPKNS